MDPFISKYDPAGNLIWVKQITGLAESIGASIAAAPDGSIYVGGGYRGSNDFDPGPGVYNLTGGYDNHNIFILKLDSNGNFVWVLNIGHNIGNQDIWDLAVDPSGDVIIGGEISGRSADPTPFGSFVSIASDGMRDGFVSKISASGVFQWVKRVGGLFNDVVWSIDVDGAGNTYAVGGSGPNTTGMASFPTAGGFVIKLDGNGNTIWADLSTDATSFRSVTLDAVGNIYAGGTGTVDLVKLNSSGLRQWAKTIGSNITLDFGADGYLYATGTYSGTSVFGSTTLTSNGAADIYIAKLDNAGNISWAKSVGGPGDYGPPSAILANVPNQLLVSGVFQQTVDFDPAASVYELTSPPGTTSSFILKLGTPDLTLTLENSLSVLAVGASSDITVYIENIKAVATFSAVSVTISKPTASSGLVLSIDPTSDWTVTQTATQFTLTLVGNIAALDTRLFTAKLTRTGGNAGTYNFTPVIANNAGGDANNTNNRASVVFTKI